MSSRGVRSPSREGLIFDAYPRSQDTGAGTILAWTFGAIILITSLALSAASLGMIANGDIGDGVNNCTSTSFNLTMLCPDGYNCTLTGEQPGCSEIDLFLTNYTTINNITHVNQTVFNQTSQYLNQTITGNLTEIFPNGSIPAGVSLVLKNYTTNEFITQWLNQTLASYYYNQTFIGNLTDLYPDGQLPSGNTTFILHNDTFITQVNETTFYYNVTAYGNMSNIFPSGAIPNNITVVTSDTVVQNFNSYDMTFYGNYTDLFPDGQLPAGNITLNLQNDTYLTEVTQYLNQTIEYYNQTFYGNLSEVTISENSTFYVDNTTNNYNTIQQTVIQQTIVFNGTEFTPCSPIAPTLITVDPAATPDATNNNCTLYTTIQAAINSLMNKRAPQDIESTYTTTISVKEGEYSEALIVPSSVAGSDLRLRIVGDVRPISAYTMIDRMPFPAAPGLGGGISSMASWSLFLTSSTYDAELGTLVQGQSFIVQNTGLGGQVNLTAAGLKVGDKIYVRGTNPNTGSKSCIANITEEHADQIVYDWAVTLDWGVANTSFTILPRVSIKAPIGYGMTVATDKVTVEGIWFNTNTLAAGFENGGIKVESGSKVVLRQCAFMTFDSTTVNTPKPYPIGINLERNAIVEAGASKYTDFIDNHFGISMVEIETPFKASTESIIALGNSVITSPLAQSAEPAELLQPVMTLGNELVNLHVPNNIGLFIFTDRETALSLQNTKVVADGPIYASVYNATTAINMVSSDVLVNNKMIVYGKTDVALQLSACERVRLGIFFAYIRPSTTSMVFINAVQSNVQFGVSSLSDDYYFMHPSSRLVKARQGSRVTYFGSDKKIETGADVVVFDILSSHLYLASGCNFNGRAAATVIDLNAATLETENSQPGSTFTKYSKILNATNGASAIVNYAATTTVDYSVGGAFTYSAVGASQIKVYGGSSAGPYVYANTASGGVIVSIGAAVSTSTVASPVGALIDTSAAISSQTASPATGQIYIY